MRQHITRPDGSTVRAYDVTDDEARQLCPYGWVIYKDGPYHRARPAK